jgi:hypothetical protein
MIEIYYRIWVSLFIKIQSAQGENKNASILLSLIVLSAINCVNYFLICMLLIIFGGIDINILNKLQLNRNVENLIFVAFLFLFNYFLLVFNKKHECLLNKYENQNNKNLGRNYFIISCTAILVFVFLTILFPDFFGLVRSK